MRPAPPGRSRPSLAQASTDGAVSGAAHAAGAVHGLRMLAARLGNAAQRATGAARALGQRDIAERQDSDQALVVVEHGQAAHLDVTHVLYDVIELVVFEAVHHVFA